MTSIGARGRGVSLGISVAGILLGLVLPLPAALQLPMRGGHVTADLVAVSPAAFGFERLEGALVTMGLDGTERSTDEQWVKRYPDGGLLALPSRL